MERRPAEFEEIVMRGKPYTFVVSLYCTLMIASAFMSIDRHAQSLAGIGAPIAEIVQAELQKGALGLTGTPTVIAQGPANATGQVVSYSQNGVATFKDAVDILVNKGVDDRMDPWFARTFGIDPSGNPVHTKLEMARFQTFVRNVQWGTVNGQPFVVMVDRSNDGKQGAIYVCDVDGNLLRGYNATNGQITRVDNGHAAMGFNFEKGFWMDWLPNHAVVVTASATRH